VKRIYQVFLCVGFLSVFQILSSSNPKPNPINSKISLTFCQVQLLIQIGLYRVMDPLSKHNFTS